MRCNEHFYLSGFIALLFACVTNTVYGYGMECEKPTIITTTGITTPFSFNCTNSTTGAHFASYEIFPVCTDNSTPNGICNTVIFTATGCPYSIAPGAVCEIQGSFMPTQTGIYSLDFNDRYGSVTYYNIFCNDPSQGCITADASPFAYVTPYPGTDLINQCPLNATDGGFLSCDTAYNNESQSYTKLTFAIVADVQYAYVTSQNDGFVYQCSINADGNFDDCTNTYPCTPDNTNPPCAGWSPYAIAFATVGEVQYAYVTDVGNEYIYQCFLDAEGLFTSCSRLTPSFDSPYVLNAPYGIHFATVNAIQYAYIADAGPGGADTTGQVYQCTIKIDDNDKNNDNGSFQNCKPTISPPNAAWIPYGIDFATVNGVQYAYVADNGTNSTNGTVYQCLLNDNGNGLFSNCYSQNGPTIGHWSPSEIAVASLNGKQYAYVPSSQSGSGNMYWCPVKPNGAFDTCMPTPDSPPASWAPTDVAFRFN